MRSGDNVGLLKALGLQARPVDAPRSAAPASDTDPAAEGPSAPAGPDAADAIAREASDARADVDAVLSQITALVLGGITDDAARRSVNAELAKLKAAFAKADKFKGRKATAAFNALLGPAQDLRARADRTKDAGEWVQAHVAPMLAPVQAGIDAMASAPKAVLQKEFDGLKSDVKRYAEAGDTTALQSIVAPRLGKLHGLVTTLPKVSAQAGADLDRAAKLLLALDHVQASGLLARLAALKDARETHWPAGASLDEIAASVDTLQSGAKALIADAEALQSSLALDREIAALRARLDALKPRIDKASESPVPAYIDQRQGNVKRLAQALDEQLAARKKAPAEKSLAGLQLALDDMEKFKGLWAAHKARFDAARNGPIKAALALKLEPADLAASRDKAIHAREQEIEAMTLQGVFGPADRAIEQWVVEAGAWAGAKEAYDSLHTKDPKTGKLEDLAGKGGGAAVLDALVADLPPATPPKVLISAIKARYGVKLEQFKNLKKDKAGKNTWDIDESTKIDPTRPDPQQEVDLEGLYKVLGKVPVKDVRNVEKIERVTDDKMSGVYSGGVFTDTIALHCGRPGGPEVTPFDKPGQVVPVGEKVDPECAPLAPGDTAPWFDFTVLHEVGHAVDDAQNIMGGPRADDAGWDTHGTGHVAKKIAAKVGYDADYIERMLDDASSKAPLGKPPHPDGVKMADWERGRRDAEAWVKAIRVGKELWDDAAGSKAHQIDQRVYHEAYEGTWVSYKYAARSKGITGYQFRAPAEWFAELYAAYHMGKLNPKHPAAQWLAKLKAESRSR
jgi:hypothetical protein